MTEPQIERHPLCPYCEYDLTGLFDRFTTQYVRCPECGEEMEAHEVVFPPRPDDWTLTKALRQTALYLIRRGAIVFAILIANVLLIEGLGAALTRSVGGFTFTLPALFVSQMIFGIIVGKVMYRGFEETAGYTGLLHPMLTLGAILLVSLMIRYMLPAIMTLNHAPLDPILFMACGTAAIVIIFDYMSEMV